MYKQILLKEENELLNCLRVNYDCALLVYNSYTGKWCAMRRNSDTIACSIDSCMITLDRNTIHDLDKICY